MALLAAHDVTLYLEAPTEPLRFRARDPGDNIISQYTAKIYSPNPDPEEEDDIPVGRIRYGFIDCGLALNTKIHPGYACYEYSADYDQLYSVLHLRNGNLRKAVTNKIGTPFFNGILSIDELYIEPAHRNGNLGLAAIYTLLRTHQNRGCGIAILQAAPLNSEARPAPAETRKYQAILMRHYEKLGFTQIGKSNYMALNLDYMLCDFVCKTDDYTRSLK